MTNQYPDEGDQCPCGRGVAYEACCGPLHRGDAAPTAERLMRSRYSAFVVGDAAYLLATWHTTTRPDSVELDPELSWKRLVIESAAAGGPFDHTGEVTFTAVARTAGERLEQRERSRFVRSTGGRWVYLDGDTL